MYYELTIEKIEDDGEREVFIAERLSPSFGRHLHRFSVATRALADSIDPQVLSPDVDPMEEFEEAACEIAEEILFGRRWDASDEATLLGYSRNDGEEGN